MLRTWYVLACLPPPVRLSCFRVVAQLEGFGVGMEALDQAAESANMGFSADLVRSSDYMTHPVFNSHHSEVCPTLT